MKFLLAALTVLILFTSCSKRIAVPNEQSPGESAAFSPEVSSINIPIAFKLADLQAKLNSQFTGVLYDDNSFENNNIDNVIVKVTKLANIQLGADNGKLTISVPLRIYIKGRYKQNLYLTTAEIEKDLQFDINAKYATRLNFSPDWGLIGQTTGDYEWLKAPTLDFGPVSLPVRTFAAPALRSQLQEFASMFDRELRKNDLMRKTAEGLWKQLQKPVLLDKNYQAWLLISPTEASVTQPVLANGVLSCSMGMKCFINTFVGPQPSTAANVPLPKIIIAKMLDNAFSIGLSAETNYKTASELLKQQLMALPTSFDNGRYTLKINDVRLYSSGKRIGMEIAIDAKKARGLIKKRVVGSLNLTGVPYYDSKSQTILLTNIDYTLKTRDALLKSANWLLRGNIRNRIEEMAKYPVGEAIETSRKQIEKQLTNYRVNDNVLLNVKLPKIEPVGVYVSDDAMRVFIRLNGVVKLDIDKF